MTTTQRNTIFGMCKSLGMSEDDRRALIFGLTGKESTKELTDSQTEAVIGELRKRCGSVLCPPKKRHSKADRPEVPGMITTQQRKHAFALLYELKEYDEKPSKASDGARMAGIIRKELGITAYEGQYLWEWVNEKSAQKLIEILKGYVLSAKRKARRKSND